MKKEDEKILRQALKDFRALNDANFENKESWKTDVRFAFNINNGQWDKGVKEERDANNRPYLTFNKIRKFVAQVANYERGIANTEDVIPVDDKGDKETAKVLNDIVTDIEYQSNCDKIYNLAGKHAVSGGFGYWRIKSEFTDEGFDQELKIVPIKNPLNVEYDPKGMKGFIRECFTKDEFEERWPDAEVVDFTEGDGNELWYEEDRVWVAEYFRKEPYDRTIVEVTTPDGTGIFEITKENEKKIRKMQILRERTLRAYKVMWYKMTGVEILDRGEWVGKDIPIIEVVGEENYLEGIRYLQSLHCDAKDPAKMFNYQLTAQTEKTALNIKAPHLLTPEQIHGHKEMWDAANNENRIYLLYNHTVDGKPERSQPPVIDPAAQNLMIIADQNIKDVLGIYGPSLGEQSNERSGKAILARKANADQTTSQFPNNLREAILETKRQLIYCIPKIYDNARILRLRGTGTSYQINFPELDDNMKEIKINDLSKGRYDYRVKQTMSLSKRQQAYENIRDLMQYSPPEYAGALLPIALEYSDFAGSDKAIAAIQGIQQQQMAIQQQEAMPQTGGMNG
jgi:hypothetical protein